MNPPRGQRWASPAGRDHVVNAVVAGYAFMRPLRFPNRSKPVPLEELYSSWLCLEVE